MRKIMNNLKIYKIYSAGALLFLVLLGFYSCSQKQNNAGRNLDQVDSNKITGKIEIREKANNKEPSPLEEPPLLLRVKIGEDSTIVSENKGYAISGSFDGEELEISSLNYRVFENDDVEFKYPKQFYFKVENKIYGVVWSFVGDDFSIFLHSMKKQKTIDDFVDQLEAFHFRRGNDVRLVEKNSIELNGIILDGTIVEIKAGDLTFRQEYYNIPAGGKGNYLLSFSDVLTYNGHLSSEASTALTLLSESLKVSKN